MSEPYAVFIGDVALDEFFRPSQWPVTGTKIDLFPVATEVGGMIANAAAVYAGFGEQTRFLWAMNDGALTQQLLTDLEAQGIDIGLVIRNPELADSRNIIILTDGEHTVMTPALGLATIDGDCGTEPVAWEPVGRLSRYDMRYRLRFLVPNGTTPLLERLKYCPELFLGADSTRKAIFLISDGANICRMGGEDVCDWAEAMAQRNITVNILTFLGASTENTDAFAEYGCLADNTGGQILYMDNYRCSYEYYGNSLIESCRLKIPGLRRVQCWGPAVKELWAVVVE